MVMSTLGIISIGGCVLPGVELHLAVCPLVGMSTGSYVSGGCVPGGHLSGEVSLEARSPGGSNPRFQLKEHPNAQISLFLSQIYIRAFIISEKEYFSSQPLQKIAYDQHFIDICVATSGLK